MNANGFICARMRAHQVISFLHPSPLIPRYLHHHPCPPKRSYVPDAYVAADEVPQARPHPFMVWKNAIMLNVSPISSIVKVWRSGVN